eukprot:1113406-Pyramimonas_sp.AAC.1
MSLKDAQLQARVTTPGRLTTKYPAPQTIDSRCRGSEIRHTGPLQEGTCEAGNRAADEHNDTLLFSTPLMTGLDLRADTGACGITRGPQTAGPRSLAAMHNAPGSPTAPAPPGCRGN